MSPHLDSDVNEPGLARPKLPDISTNCGAEHVLADSYNITTRPRLRGSKAKPVVQVHLPTYNLMNVGDPKQ
jgi:hypothetical protein